ncbi:MAG TPA: S8 family serine peptidase [Paracoccaceae bacterium]|nr:S8 family serine peptidase [Paracoccaceae bacterium]
MTKGACDPANEAEGDSAPRPFADKKYLMPEYTGFRPTFPALWHLWRLKVADKLEPFASAAWEKIAKAQKPAVRVAVIDTPVAHKHPNLVGAIDLGLARDFSVFDTGLFVERDISGDDKASRDGLAAKVREGGGGLAEAIRRELEAIQQGKQGGPARSPFAPAPYGAHGTAIAGLIGARPARIAFRKPAYLGDSQEDAVTEKCFPLPYAGINPFCRIVPISTTAAPNTRMILGALEYARLIEAEIVVIAAEWADGIDRDEDCHGWQSVDDALLSLCRSARVFCAAGNLNSGALSYPASLSGCDAAHRPWAVTACDETGRLLTYAPPPLPGHRMLRCLSTEHPRYDRREKRLDPWEARDPEIRLPEEAKDYPGRHIIATDPPGRWGYNPSPFEHDPTADRRPDTTLGTAGHSEPGTSRLSGASKEHYEIGSLFCRFSGTSAATALAAGLVSLALALERTETSDGDGQSSREAGTDMTHAENRLFDLHLARALVRRPV